MDRLDQSLPPVSSTAASPLFPSDLCRIASAPGYFAEHRPNTPESVPATEHDQTHLKSQLSSHLQRLLKNLISK
jgi:hypothetical protein